MSGDWAFLNGQFRVLQGAVRIHDPSPFVVDRDTVRLGRDGVDDELWIDVRIRENEAATAAQRAARCQALHEALVLTSVMATVDYEAWRCALRSISALIIPDAVDPGATPQRLRPQYRLQLPTDSKYNWASIQAIIAPDECSDLFEEQYALVRQVVARRGIPMDDDARFRVTVYDCPQGGTRRHQLAHVKSISRTIVALQDHEDQGSARATLRLDSIQLTLQNLDIHSSVFREILAVVETGVCINCLGLPSNFPEDEDRDQTARFEMWSHLASAVCGRPQRPTKGPVIVKQLVVPSEYDFPEMLVQLLSVLGEARSLTSLKFCAGSLHGDSHGFFWLWIGYALFRADSRCSIEVLDLDMIELAPRVIAHLHDAMTLPDPLGLLWQKTTQTSVNVPAAGPTGRTVVVPAGTTVQPYGDDPGTFLDDFVVPVDWSGVMVHDDSTSDSVDALLFGVGFCAIERASLPNKRQRVDNTAVVEPRAVEGNKIRTLILGMSGHNEQEDTTCRIDALLSLVGAELTSLSISVPDADGQLERCLRACPKLQHLRLECCQLTSMDPIVHSYHRGGLISSLELSEVEVQSSFLPQFDSFLNQLLVPGPMKRTLKKLRIGHQWAALFRQSTADVIKQVLNDPLTLDYLHVYRCENPRVAPPIDWDIASHQGEIIPVVGTPALGVRVAFASVIKHLRSREQFSRLEDEVLTQVFEYVGQTKKRVVISEVNTFYNSRMFAARRTG